MAHGVLFLAVLIATAGTVDAQPPCIDIMNTAQCKTWASEGKCANDSLFHLIMLQNCQVACDLCPTVSHEHMSTYTRAHTHTHTLHVKWSRSVTCTAEYETFLDVTSNTSATIK